jgi:prevent-host-death family protein
MNLVQNVKPISYIKTNAAQMMDYVNEHKSPVLVTQRGEARAVLLDPESYQDMVNALTLMRLLQRGEEDIKEGRVYSQEEVFDGLRAKYTNGKLSE